ncbi:SDR family NAD(P)-dependent oxidoreductase [Pedobacter miscanthi]|uniref:SDR family NAD(P)-dependent oxidoreductase n=1 Tax=Pedobacter miscanthi TaxID=2259170 RepID=UPI002930DF46|nr:SDR family NAD(P)-dependent oxidoreductase [Pedobacter miscanthi]
MHHKLKALVTGARTGIGLELTKKLLLEGWQVVALIRSPFKEDDELIQRALKAKSLVVYLTDLGDFKVLAGTLKKLRDQEPYLDVIFNNAGSMSGSLSYSAQGREIDFEINTVVPYIVAKELEELLLKGKLRTIVNTSSEAALMAKDFKPEQLEKPTVFKKLFGVYASSKLALSLWTNEFAQNIKNDIKIRSVDPGPAKTDMSKGRGMPWFILLLRPLLFPHPSKGAKNVYDAAFGEFKNENGVFVSRGKIKPLKNIDKGLIVLSKVDRIYQKEILGDR